MTFRNIVVFASLFAFLISTGTEAAFAKTTHHHSHHHSLKHAKARYASTKHAKAKHVAVRTVRAKTVKIASAKTYKSARAANRVPAGKALYAGLIARYASANGVPLALANAVIRTESNFNPRVTGGAGEIGLMQIKYQTARGMGYAGSRQGLYDPETNIRYGMKYLAGAHRRGGGSICGTLLKYQGGHYATRVSSVSQKYCRTVRNHMGEKQFAAN